MNSKAIIGLVVGFRYRDGWYTRSPFLSSQFLGDFCFLVPTTVGCEVSSPLPHISMIRPTL